MEVEKHRQNIRTILTWSNATPFKGFMGLGYGCCFCTEQYPDPAELKIHTRSHGTIANMLQVKVLFDLIVKLDITDLKCNICTSKIDSLEELMTHLDAHDKLIHLNIKNHIIPFKFDTEVLTCVVCKEEFKYFKILIEHMVRHYNNFECNVCGKGFINKRHLTNHSIRHDVGVYNCRYCHKEFDSKIKTSTHERVFHKYNYKTRKCRYCSEKFISRLQMNKHEVAVHDAEPEEHLCKICSRKFNCQLALDNHTKRDHLMLRPYSCTECDMSFFTKADLKGHSVTHTGEKNFQCQVCNKAYGRKKTLAVHMRIHTNERRFKCEYCGQTFIQKVGWKAHVRTKHGEIV